MQSGPWLSTFLLRRAALARRPIGPERFVDANDRHPTKQVARAYADLDMGADPNERAS